MLPHQERSFIPNVPNPGRMAVIAPLPEDETQCRWCLGRRREVLAFEPLYCERGCAANDTTEFYLRTCSSCRLDFQTGYDKAEQCHWCATTERQQTEREMQAESVARGTYRYERLKRGGWR